MLELLGNLVIDSDSAFIDKLISCSNSENLEVLTGFTCENIKVIKDMLYSLCNSGNRSVIQTIPKFLIELRTGNSNHTIVALFQFGTATRH